MSQPLTAYLTDAPVSLISRQRTPEGFLRATAAVMRTGIQQYETAELGLPGPNRVVGVFRGAESVFADETRDSLKGKPVTMGHPRTAGT